MLFIAAISAKIDIESYRESLLARQKSLHAKIRKVSVVWNLQRLYTCNFAYDPWAYNQKVLMWWLDKNVNMCTHLCMK